MTNGASTLERAQKVLPNDPLMIPAQLN